MTLDLDWDLPLAYRKGSETRLDGIDVYYEFDWGRHFSDGRAQFRGGQCLAKFVREAAPDGKTPALLLTDRDDVEVGSRETDQHFVFVLNLPEYKAIHADAALTYLASRVGPGITQISHIQELAAARPEVAEAIIAAHLRLAHIGRWVAADPQRRREEIRGLAEVGDPAQGEASLSGILAGLDALGDLDPEIVAAIAGFFGPGTDRDRRLQLLRAVTDDPDGRYVTGEVLAERTPQRVADARSAMAEYQALLDDETSNETDMQSFIERNLWLLGLDYAEMRSRPPGLRGVTDFLLERFDGFHDLLELKSPHDELIRAPDTDAGDPPPSASAYALSRDLAQALAQAHVYRDRLTRHADATQDLLGLPHTRDPRLIIVIGKADVLPEHRKRVLRELNKSLHRVEIVPYDVLAKRAEAILDNVDRYMLVAEEAPDPTEEGEAA